ncbi:phage protein NinX family protein [Paraburkholderia sp. GAS82]|uniref:phage protein NinX family protein n=1 Tax=Paraburkholderia sp. GAS82 TaxID=3035137 RepID=UPI003D1D982A
MNIEQLAGADLDYWTARAEGHIAELCGLHGLRYCRIDVYPDGHQFYQPTENWLLAAAIAHRRRYTQYPRLDRYNDATHQWVWLAEAQQNSQFHGQFVDASPRVAICRLRVAEAIAEGSLNVDREPVAREPDPVYEQLGISMMNDEQAFASFQRWKELCRPSAYSAVSTKEQS